MTRDTDLIRRGDAIKAVTDADLECRGAHGARENIAAIPAPVVPAEGLDALVKRAYRAANSCLTNDDAIIRELAGAITALRTAPPVGIDHLRAAAVALAEVIEQHNHKGPLSDEAMMMCWLRAQDVVAALRSAPPVGARVAVQDDAAAFDKADWFWRTMDPDDCGDSPEEAINRAMVGKFCVCEIASSYRGPTRYGFSAPVLDPASDDEEFVHFATQQEAVEAAKTRRAALLPAGEGG